MQLDLKRARIANKISVGDEHDLSIEWVMTHTDYPVYVIERIGERFRIMGAEITAETKEVKHEDGEKKASGTETEKLDTPKRKDGKRGFTGKARSRRK